MKTILISLVLMMSPLFATTQESELWIVNGRPVYCKNFPHISKVLPKHKIPEFDYLHTGNYKGYTASWAVIDDQLYLVGIVALLKGDKELSGNADVLRGVTFPVKVTNWSGIVSNRTEVTDLLPDTKPKSYYEVTKITFKNGKLVDFVFNQKEEK